MPALQKDMRADRHTQFVLLVRFNGIYWPDANFAMQVRLKPDSPNAPLITLGIVADDSNGIKRVAAMGAANGKPPFTVIAIQINRAALEALPPAPAVGLPAEFAYDIIVTPNGQPAQRRLYGAFYVDAGVTQ